MNEDELIKALGDSVTNQPVHEQHKAALQILLANKLGGAIRQLSDVSSEQMSIAEKQARAAEAQAKAAGKNVRLTLYLTIATVVAALAALGTAVIGLVALGK